MKNSTANLHTYTKRLLLIILLEGFAAFYLYFHQPSSMQRNAVLFGLSTSRLAIGVVISFLLIILAFLTYLAHIRQPVFEKRLQNICDELHDGHSLLLCTMIVILIMVTFFITGFVLPRLQLLFSSFLSPSFDQFISTLISIIKITRPFFTWAILILIQLLAFLFIIFREKYSEKSFFHLNTIWKTLLVYLAFLLSIFHWAVLFFRLYIFVAIPNWFWKFYDKPVAHPYLFFVLFNVAIVVSLFILSHPEKPKLNVFLVFLCGFSLMVGFGFIENDGFETLRQLFIQKGHWGYARYACTQPGLLETLRNYENVAQLDPFFKTKPPGVFAFYISIQQFVNMLNPADTLEERYFLLTRFMSYTFPALAFVVLFALYHFTRQISADNHEVLPCLFYIFFPNVILTPLFLDQELYPLLFTVGLLLCLQIIRKQSNIWAFVTGAYLYISIYFSFSLLPLIPLVFLWVGIDYLQNRQTRDFKKIISILFYLLLGITVQYAVFRIFLNYDVFIRYANAMASHRTHKEFLVNVNSIIEAIQVNNIEFFSWIGFPIAILLISRAGRVLSHLFQRDISKTDSLFISLTFVYTLLNLSGQTHGEVARLWIFLVPMASFFSSLEVRSLFKQRKFLPVYFITLQLITMFLLFRYQDLD